MRLKVWSKLGMGAILAGALGACALQALEEPATPLVRIAELEIDPAQLQTYKTALKEEIEASIRLERGVLTLYAVSLRENPAQIRIFETYADRDAYESHLKTAHFLKYKAGTQHMIKSLKLLETAPIYLGAKR